MALFGLVFGFWEFSIIIGLIIWGSIGAFQDRGGEPSAAKWFSFLGIVISVVILSYNSLVGPGSWIPSLETLLRIVKVGGAYLCLGLAYSCLETYFQLRTIKGKLKFQWDELRKAVRIFDTSTGEKRITLTVGRALERAVAQESSEDNIFLIDVKKKVDNFCDYFNSNNPHQILRVIPNKERGNLFPTVEFRVSNLVRDISAWVVLWPFYALTLVFGEFLQMLWEKFANLVARLFKETLRRMFKDVFDVAPDKE